MLSQSEQTGNHIMLSHTVHSFSITASYTLITAKINNLLSVLETWANKETFGRDAAAYTEARNREVGENVKFLRIKLAFPMFKDLAYT